MKFKTTVYMQKNGRFTGQVQLAGVVIHEDEGNVSESQAIANVEQSFALTLAAAMEDFAVREAEAVDAE